MGKRVMYVCLGVLVLAGAAASQPVCDVAPTSLDFGVVTVGNYADDTFRITNVGTGLLEGTVSETSDDYSLVSGGGAYSLADGEFVDVVVRFEPTIGGLCECTVATGSLCADVSCTGMGDLPTGREASNWGRIKSLFN
jgi:hypothetical protein